MGNGDWSENALTVLRKRYLRRDEQGNAVEEPADMFRRVARNLALMELLFHPEVYDPEGRQDPGLAESK
ncbi:MAG: hypothetical protein M0031_06120 [Thermaerobacter sp.]|jgi:ribonucleotide reductase alpha subunit|nr:hypothetical protein [Thermaerobacter sp.]